jgi:hypothetical protein
MAKRTGFILLYSSAAKGAWLRKSIVFPAGSSRRPGNFGEILRAVPGVPEILAKPCGQFPAVGRRVIFDRENLIG